MEPEQIPIRDLHLPDAIGWWPPAPGWWLLLGLCAVGVAWLCWRYVQVWAEGRSRRHALRRLESLLDAYEADRDAARFGAAVSALLRRTMLAYAPRSEVAGLTGEAWLEWLDRDLAVPQFKAGPGRSLLDLPYRRPESEVTSAEVYELVTAVRQRVATPVGGTR